jgi:hypothetical protein
MFVSYPRGLHSEIKWFFARRSGSKASSLFCQIPVTSIELFIDPVFLKLLAKYPNESGCVVRKDGSDSQLSESDTNFLADGNEETVVRWLRLCGYVSVHLSSLPI